MSDVVADVLAKWRVVPENNVSLSVFAFQWLSWWVRSGGCIDIHLRQVLFGTGGGFVE